MAASLCDHDDCLFLPVHALGRIMPEWEDVLPDLMVMSPSEGEVHPTTTAVGSKVTAWCYKHYNTRSSIYMDADGHAYRYRSGVLFPYLSPREALDYLLS